MQFLYYDTEWIWELENMIWSKITREIIHNWLRLFNSAYNITYDLVNFFYLWDMIV